MSARRPASASTCETGTTSSSSRQHNEETPELLYDFVTTRINITLDARTMRSRKQQQLMENEIRRIIHTKRKGDGTNMDRLVYKTRTDLSDRTKLLFRTTFQVEVVIFAELIP